MTEKPCRDHLVGIGGTGMCALACLLQEKGETISGCDRVDSDRLRRLKARGIRVSVGHDAAHVADADRLILSGAVPKDHPEVLAARELGLPILTRGQRLSELSASCETLAVAGSHGKTTTTCMLRSIFRAADRDPSFLSGAAPMGESQGHWGRENTLITEADESDGSFLLLQPRHAIVTNCDGDHLDYWGSREEALAGFLRFMHQVEGILVLDGDDAGTQMLLPELGRPCITAGFSAKSDFWAEPLGEKLGENRFAMYDIRGRLGEVTLRVPGKHNIKNALMAGALALSMGISFAAVQAGLGHFAGAERRFAWSKHGAVTLVDDYAHHPREIESTLRTVRSLHPGRVVTVFEPHRYSRTELLYDELTKSFDCTDVLVVTRIFAAGERTRAVSGDMLADGISRRGRSKVYYVHSEKAVVPFLQNEIKDGDAVVFLGAGTIGSMAQHLREVLG